MVSLHSEYGSTNSAELEIGIVPNQTRQLVSTYSEKKISNARGARAHVPTSWRRHWVSCTWQQFRQSRNNAFASSVSVGQTHPSLWMELAAVHTAGWSCSSCRHRHGLTWSAASSQAAVETRSSSPATTTAAGLRSPRRTSDNRTAAQRPWSLRQTVGLD